MTANTNTRPASTPNSISELHEMSLLGALLNRGRKVSRLPKFDQLTTAHFSNPLSAAVFALCRHDKNFVQTHNIQTRANILKSQPAFELVPDHRAFLENLMLSESDPVRSLRALLQLGPIHPEHASIKILVSTVQPAPIPDPAPIRPIGPVGPISENSASSDLARTKESPEVPIPDTFPLKTVASASESPLSPLSPISEAPTPPPQPAPKSAICNSQSAIGSSPLENPTPPPASAPQSAISNSQSAIGSSPLPTTHSPLERKLQRKLRSDSAFAQLTDEQHLQLQQWLHDHSYAKVVRLVAKPAPEGFGIKTHITSLCRYFYAAMHDDLLEIRQDIGADFKDLAALCQADPIAYRAITRENLERHLMVLSSDPKPNLPLILRLMRALQRDQEFEFKKAQAAARPAICNPKSATRNQEMPLASMNALVTALTQAEPLQSGNAATEILNSKLNTNTVLHDNTRSLANFHTHAHSNAQPKAQNVTLPTAKAA